MAGRYDTIAERRRQWETLDRMLPVDDVFRQHVDRMLRARGIGALPGMYEAKAWRPDLG